MAETPVMQTPVQTYGSIPGENERDQPKQFPPLTDLGSTDTFTFATRTSSGSRVPQAIAHRGYKAKFPENTLGAFKGAVDVGADAIETDIHLSQDGVVVLSHDADLQRCFGQPDKIITRDWSYLSTLRTLAAPHESMPRLKDLLEYLTQPGCEHIWVLLDVKVDNDAEEVMKRIAETVHSVPAVDKRPWHERIVVGIWSASWLTQTHTHLPLYPVTHISFSLLTSSRLLSVPNISFNIPHFILRIPFFGRRFVRRAHSP
ncbi:PLC-like phosphodiesterase [Pseudovirgaria hyperparasitica]|uniref:PLC-like phosphodiesterase n=1 Tax=Pseudovirgaria hyperparasitica TaxID=470096 RepID=A0A6A6W606_9PEZI|nr:PLC-like phosphodiesterase [Pseudovirgaria hyperparasitica]KAF2758358.1 PLC-like phosphodiesterase [Pseudovirgaria hyperparasitica]